MNPLLYLILAHFLADFPFQPNRLVVYKQTHFSGVLIHSLTHLVTSAVLMLPYLKNSTVWVGIFLIFLLHNAIDQIKILANRRKGVNKFVTYILDQIGHLAGIALISIYLIGILEPPFMGVGSEFYLDSSFVLYLLILVICTYFFDVTRWTYRNNQKAQPYQRDYALISRNAIITTLAFVIYWLTR